MTKILFICHGNICRSPMAEYLMKDLVKKLGREKEFQIASAATSTEEIGNPVHYGTRNKLRELGIECSEKRAVQVTKKDYMVYQYFLAMDSWNIRNLQRILGGDMEHKVFRLLDFTERVGEDIADPWYTGDFEATYQDIMEGLMGFLQYLDKKKRSSEGYNI